MMSWSLAFINVGGWILAASIAAYGRTGHSPWWQPTLHALGIAVVSISAWERGRKTK